MKTLQRNFTTQEQSKRLLELGVPADSSDLYCVVKNNYTALLDEYVVYSLQEQRMIQVSKTTYRKELKKGEDILPCWSVGRLIEIHLKCCTTLNQNDAHIVISRFGIETGGLLQNMCDMVGECALLGKYDFSKLEE